MPPDESSGLRTLQPHNTKFLSFNGVCVALFLKVTVQNPLTIFNRPVAEYMNDEESDHQSIMIDEAHRAQDALQVDVRARYSGTPIDTGYQAQQAQHDTQSHALQVLFVTRVLVRHNMISQRGCRTLKRPVCICTQFGA